MTATSKRTRAAADFLQQSVKKAKASAPVTTTPSNAPVLPAVSDSLAALHAIIYPEGKKAAHELTPFQRRVYAITRRIPAGHVSTYKHIAESLSCPRAYRAVGNALRQNPFAPQVPCHRVLASDGTLGGFAGGRGACERTQCKRTMLEAEGVRFEADGSALRKDAAYRAAVVLTHIDAAGIDEESADQHLLRSA